MKTINGEVIPDTIEEAAQLALIDIKHWKEKEKLINELGTKEFRIFRAVQRLLEAEKRRKGHLEKLLIALLDVRVRMEHHLLRPVLQLPEGKIYQTKDNTLQLLPDNGMTKDRDVYVDGNDIIHLAPTKDEERFIKRIFKLDFRKKEAKLRSLLLPKDWKRRYDLVWKGAISVDGSPPPKIGKPVTYRVKSKSKKRIYFADTPWAASRIIARELKMQPDTVLKYYRRRIKKHSN